MFPKEDNRAKCFQVWKFINIAVIILVLVTCGVINYNSDACLRISCVATIFGHHLVFAVPSIIFHILERRFNIFSCLRANTTFICLASLFYLCVMIWTLITYIKINTTEDEDTQEVLSLLLFHDLIPGCIIATPFLIIASFYIDENPIQTEHDIESDMEMPVIHPSHLALAITLSHQNRVF
ncbi:unnamed protein product [Moneuplotes crassus]|uniref:Uncharacterized protein n=1 Tax=Euplotes crassus TaxID=5936 RepID=A0AAD1XY98_EUPCR|nr:unnamed protein product [Moneuplotes crassus]